MIDYFPQNVIFRFKLCYLLNTLYIIFLLRSRRCESFKKPNWTWSKESALTLQSTIFKWYSIVPFIERTFCNIDLIFIIYFQLISIFLRSFLSLETLVKQKYISVWKWFSKFFLLFCMWWILEDKTVFFQCVFRFSVHFFTYPGNFSSISCLNCKRL